MKKDFSSPQKKYLCVGEVYAMENNGTNTDHQKVVRAAEQKWEIVETTFGIIFLFDIHIHYFLYREFSSSTWKESLPPELPIPTPNHNLT